MCDQSVSSYWGRTRGRRRARLEVIGRHLVALRALVEVSKSLGDARRIPERAVLLLEEDELPRGARSRREPGSESSISASRACTRGRSQSGLVEVRAAASEMPLAAHDLANFDDAALERRTIPCELRSRGEDLSHTHCSISTPRCGSVSVS